ncbi:hypothetical protein J4463_04295 [Candidatus Pacearchaeota archaeon]|nr:hypothetical protein [Candidatus Pacearchaeota archaeon]
MGVAALTRARILKPRRNYHFETAVASPHYTVFFREDLNVSERTYSYFSPRERVLSFSEMAEKYFNNFLLLNDSPDVETLAQAISGSWIGMQSVNRFSGAYTQRVIPPVVWNYPDSQTQFRRDPKLRSCEILFSPLPREEFDRLVDLINQRFQV